MDGSNPSPERTHHLRTLGSPVRRPRILLALFVAAHSSVGGASTTALAEPAGDVCLRLDTGAGAITLRLARAAAPAAISAIARLATNPIYDAGVVPRPAAASATGYFDGLAFDYTRPHLEIRLAAREPVAAFTVASELDAAALGLETTLVADAGEAMNAMQFDLLPALKRPNSTRQSTPTLVEWASRFEANGFDASFLVGKSRRELFEAIGYRFTSGLASLPATRGAVALVPASPAESVLSLAILLADHPTRTGRWVVVGQVASGLEVAEALSLAPHALPQAKDYRPLVPAFVLHAEVLSSCPPSTEGGPP